jgi:hypothetical protein
VNEQLEERKRILISNEILEQAGELEEELKRKKKYWTPNPYGLC